MNILLISLGRFESALFFYFGCLKQFQFHSIYLRPRAATWLSFASHFGPGSLMKIIAIDGLMFAHTSIFPLLLMCFWHIFSNFFLGFCYASAYLRPSLVIVLLCEEPLHTLRAETSRVRIKMKKECSKRVHCMSSRIQTTEKYFAYVITNSNIMQGLAASRCVYFLIYFFFCFLLFSLARSLLCPDHTM